MENSVTTNSPVLPYADYYNNFNLSALLTEIFHGNIENYHNAYMACCGRHVNDGKGNKVALVHEDINGEQTSLTFKELADKSGQVANLLKSYGVGKGDRVATMLPRTPELLIVVLATWRIGAIYQPLFTAFGVESIVYRLQKAQTKVVFTNLENRHKFAEITDLPKMVLVTKNSDSELDNKYDDANFNESYQHSEAFPPVKLTTDDAFLQMFTSGTVGKSKGVSVPLSALPTFYLYMRYAIDLRDSDNYWNMADPGWAYGLYYGITGPLLMGITTYFNRPLSKPLKH